MITILATATLESKRGYLFELIISLFELIGVVAVQLISLKRVKLPQEEEVFMNNGKKVLASKFSKISDIELIGELQKRIKFQAIKLSMCMYSGQKRISIETKDTKEISFPLPIEIKEGGSHD